MDAEKRREFAALDSIAVGLALTAPPIAFWLFCHTVNLRVFWTNGLFEWLLTLMVVAGAFKIGRGIHEYRQVPDAPVVKVETGARDTLLRAVNAGTDRADGE